MAIFRFFQKLEISTSGPIRRPNMRHHTKFREDRSKCCGDMANFSRWLPSAILDWFYACWIHPRRVLGGFCDCAKFVCNRCSNFDSMQILIFCTLSLKMRIHAPKNRGFGGFYPQNGEQYDRDPQKAHPWAETRGMTYRSSKLSTCAGWARAEA